MRSLNSYIILLFLSFSTPPLFSQIILQGRVLDMHTNDGLASATVVVSSSKEGVITNTSGAFSLNCLSCALQDSLTVSHIGFETKTLAIRNFISSSKRIFLEKTSYQIMEVSLESDFDIYKKLFSLIQKKRKENTSYESKAFFTLTTLQNDTVNIESVEGLYNASISASSVVEDMRFKTGRFSQNEQIKFFSLNSTDIISKFDFFSKRKKRRLPIWPGNLTITKLKKDYNLNIESCVNCAIEFRKISFSPVELNSDNFSGSIVYDYQTDAILAFDLSSNSRNSFFQSIDANHELGNEHIQIGVNYDQFNGLVKTIEFDYSIEYKMSDWMHINTNSTFFFYDTNAPFSEAYFSNAIDFKNDYERIYTHESTKDFWLTHYKLPYVEFEHENRIVVDNSTSSILDRLESFDFPYISWSKEEKIKLTDLNFISTDFGIINKELLNANNKNLRSDMYNLSFTYYLDAYQKKDSTIFLTKTLFNSSKSYYFLETNFNTELLINIIFSSYQSGLLQLKRALLEVNDFELAKELTLKTQGEADKRMNLIIRQTEHGLNTQELVKWNEVLKEAVGADNLKDVIVYPFGSNSQPYSNKTLSKNINYYNIGTAYLLMENYEMAILYLTYSLGFQTRFENDSYYNRALSFIKLGEYEKACLDLNQIVALDKVEELILEYCYK